MKEINCQNGESTDITESRHTDNPGWVRVLELQTSL